jgi:hypothetical protein
VDNYIVLKMGTAKPYHFHSNVVKRYPPGQVKKYVQGTGKGKKKKKLN